MYSNTHTNNVSSDIPALIAEAHSINLPTDWATLLRVARALTLLDNNSIRKLDHAGHARIYEVKSGTRNLVHLVVANGETKCTCEDARRHDYTNCKHAYAVRIHEARIADCETYHQWLEERHNY